MVDSIQPSFLVDGFPIWIIDNFLLPHEHEQMYVYCSKSLYTLEHTSSPHQENFYPRLVANLTTEQINTLPLTREFNDSLKMIGVQAKIDRAYINLSNKETVCVEHVDDDSFGMSMIYYPNTTWNLNWGGETMFFNSKKEVSMTSIVKPNRAIFFDPRILHTGRAPTFAAKANRYTIVYKSKGE